MASISTKMIVIDASALLAVVLSEPERDALIVATRGVALLGPASLPWEIGNGLVAALRRRRLSLTEATRAWESCGRIPLRLVDVSVGDAIRLAAARGLYAYDAYVLALAHDRKLALLTLDGALRRSASAVGVSLLEY